MQARRLPAPYYDLKPEDDTSRKPTEALTDAELRMLVYHFTRLKNGEIDKVDSEWDANRRRFRIYDYVKA